MRLELPFKTVKGVTVDEVARRLVATGFYKDTTKINMQYGEHLLLDNIARWADDGALNCASVQDIVVHTCTRAAAAWAELLALWTVTASTCPLHNMVCAPDDLSAHMVCVGCVQWLVCDGEA